MAPRERPPETSQSSRLSRLDRARLGEITNQDYSNMEHVQIGMKSNGGPAIRLNRRQEVNILHMHRVIDRYLTRA